MGASPRTKILLALRSGGICALPPCTKKLTVDGAISEAEIIGEAAHIAGEHNGAARFDSGMTEDQRNNYSNLIFLCGSCHTQIDKQPDDFPTALLIQIKQQHENRVRESMVDSFSDIGFPELEEATKWIMSIGPDLSLTNFSLIPPEEKIKKNDLGSRSRAVITMGLSISGEVKEYVESVSQVDPQFPERLKAGFLIEYYKLKKEGCAGDDLFDLMCKYAQRGFDIQTDKLAGIAVLVYLFEACEVFEK